MNDATTNARPGKPAARLPAVTFPLTWEVGEGRHELAVSLAFDGAGGALRELVFVSRGKIGQNLDHMLKDLGIKLSRAIQGRDPDTGTAADVVPALTLTAFDPLAAHLVRLWAALRGHDHHAAMIVWEEMVRLAEGLDEAPPARVAEAEEQAEAMLRWRRAQGLHGLNSG